MEPVRPLGRFSDFRVYLCYVWEKLGLPAPTAIQLDIAYCLQHGRSGKQDRLIIEGFRGVGKSWITAAFVTWVWLNNPHTKVLVVSANQDTADEIALFIRSLIRDIPLLHHLEPQPGQVDKLTRFDVGPAGKSKDRSLKSVGITGQLTGGRANLIIADDIEVPKNSFTFALRNRLRELVKEFDAVLTPGGRVLYLGTPQVEDSLYVVLEERGYQAIVWPSEIPEDPGKYRGRLGPYIENLISLGWDSHRPTEPKRFGPEELLARKLSYGRAEYARQFLLDTTLTDQDKRPLRCVNLLVDEADADRGFVSLMWAGDKEHTLNDVICGGIGDDRYVRPAWRSTEVEPWQGTVMAVDPSGKGSDETAVSVVRHLQGRLHLVACRGWKEGYADSTLRQIADMALDLKVQTIIVEQLYGGGMFDKLLQPHLVQAAKDRGLTSPGARVLDPSEWAGWSTTMKERRICDTLEPLLNSHRLAVSPSVITEDAHMLEKDRQYSLIWQMTRMERESGALPHDDRVDSLAMACSYWTDMMSINTDQARDRIVRERLNAELREFIKTSKSSRNLLSKGSQSALTRPQRLTQGSRR